MSPTGKSKKAAARNNAPSPISNATSTKAGTLKPPAKGVAVRMYRQGLGDCFLLAFSTGNEDEAFYVLIDCGVILGTKSPGEMMDKVARDINEACNGHIHLLVVTHEHWDHVSGFLQAADAFKNFKRVHHVWLGWTEDPKDELANRLRRQFDDELGLLRRVAGLAPNVKPVALSSSAVAQLTPLLEFFGVPANSAVAPAMANLLGTTGSADTRSAMKAAANLCANEPEYLLPGKSPRSLPKIDGASGVPGVRIYILGPPHDEGMLKRINPTKKGKEVYTEFTALTPRTAFLAALRDTAGLSDEDKDLQGLCFPFNASLRISKAEAKRIPFFRDRYGFEHHEPDAPGRAEFRDHPDAWRRIDDDWLGVAGELALKLDNYTNNTSLALGIELVESGKVLLFAADAQIGNWLSWDDYTWKVEDASGAEKNIHIDDLLKRTVFYKVGHHGSHNATVRASGEVPKGLELMNHPELVAMLPVNHEMAVVKGWDKMPFEPLLSRLEEKTAHRLMRIDDPSPKPKPEKMSAAAWRQFKKSFSETKLYIQYTVHDSD